MKIILLFLSLTFSPRLLSQINTNNILKGRVLYQSSGRHWSPSL